MSVSLLRGTKILALIAAAVFGLSACAEKPQTATATASAKKSDTPSWEGANNAYVAPGWKPGDQTSWDEQMKKRAQGQNDYSRIQ